MTETSLTKPLANAAFEAETPRPLMPALRRGIRRRCPHCGEGALFSGYLTVRDACPSCGEVLHHHRSDDLPPYLTILLVAHLIMPGILIVEANAAPPLWVAVTLWPLLALALCLTLLPPIKGAVVGLQWANRMHGFGDAVGPGDRIEDPQTH